MSQFANIHIVHYGEDYILHDFRRIWDQAIILNRPGRARDRIGEGIASGLADLESYGALLLANPDFVDRIASGGPLQSADPRIYFGTNSRGAEVGYTDSPTLTLKQVNGDKQRSNEA
jgi:N-ethylmaleimide reductase